MMDKTVVDWAGEPLRSLGKKTFYDKAIINRKEVCMYVLERERERERERGEERRVRLKITTLSGGGSR